MICERCEKREALPTDEYCEECISNLAEARYQHEQEEGFRGTEYSSFLAEQQADIQRNLK